MTPIPPSTNLSIVFGSVCLIFVLRWLPSSFFICSPNCLNFLFVKHCLIVLIPSKTLSLSWTVSAVRPSSLLASWLPWWLRFRVSHPVSWWVLWGLARLPLVLHLKISSKTYFQESWFYWVNRLRLAMTSLSRVWKATLKIFKFVPLTYVRQMVVVSWFRMRLCIPVRSLSTPPIHVVAASSWSVLVMKMTSKKPKILF